VQILTGPNAGKELELVKNLTTLGKPGVQVAVLTAARTDSSSPMSRAPFTLR